MTSNTDEGAPARPRPGRLPSLHTPSLGARDFGEGSHHNGTATTVRVGSRTLEITVPPDTGDTEGDNRYRDAPAHDGSTDLPAQRERPRTGPAHPETLWLDVNCGVLALAQLSAFTGRPNARVPQELAGIEGITAEALSDGAGAPLRPFRDHADIAAQLSPLGPGAVALVVDVYQGYTNVEGVGAHAYLLRVGDDGDVEVHDWSDSATRVFPPSVPRELAGTHAVLYDAEGMPVFTVPTDAENLAAVTRIGGRPLSDPVREFGALRRGAEDLIHVMPIPQRTIDWLRRHVVHAVETRDGRFEAVQWLQEVREYNPDATPEQIREKLETLGVDDVFKKNVDRLLATGPAARVDRFVRGAKPGGRVEGDRDAKFRAAVDRKLTSRLTTAEIDRLLSESGMPLAVEYRGTPFPVFLRLKLRARENSRPNQGPAVSTQRWTYGILETADSAGSHSLRSAALSYSYLRDMFSRTFLNLGVTPSLRATHNELSSGASVFATIQSIIKKRSTEAMAVPHDYEMQWELRLNDDGVAGVLAADLPTAEGWTPIPEPAPDDLVAWFPKYLDESPGLPKVDPDDDATIPPPYHRDPADPTPQLSLEQLPFYGPLDFPHHDRLFSDVMASFGDQVAHISQGSASQLREFFGGNFRGNIPMMHGGSVQSPTLYTASGDPLGYFQIQIPDFHGGETLTGPTTTPNASRLEYNVLRALRTMATAKISNAFGGSVSLSFGLGKGKADEKTGYAPIGANLTPFKAGLAHKHSHSLTYGGRAFTSRALRLVAHLLHTTPQMEVRVTFVRPDGPVIEPKPGTPLAPRASGGQHGKRYPVNMLVPSKASLGSAPTAEQRRYLPPDLLHLRQLGLLTTPLQVDIPQDVLDGIETYIADKGFLPPDTKHSTLLDQDSTKNQLLENSRKLAQIKARLNRLGTADEMIQGGARTVFEKSNGVDTERVTVTIKALRDYGTEDGRYDPDGDPNAGVTHEWMLPQVQTMNYSGIILAGAERSESTPFAWDVGAGFAFTNPFDVEGGQALSSVNGSYDRTGSTSNAVESGHNHAEENYTFSPGPKAAQPGIQIFGVPTRYVVEIAYSHGPSPESIEGKGSYHLAVPTYLTGATPAAGPPAEPSIRDDADTDLTEVTERLGLAATTSIEKGVGRLPLAAVVAAHPVGEILHEATIGLIADIEREAAESLDEPRDPVPGAFPESSDEVLPTHRPESETGPPAPSPWYSAVRAWFRSQPPPTESIELPVREPVPAPPTEHRAEVPDDELSEIDITDLPHPDTFLLSDSESELSAPSTESEPPRVPGAWLDDDSAQAEVGPTWSDLGNRAWAGAAGFGKWLWRNAFGVPAAHPTSGVQSAVHTAFSPHHMTSFAPLIFRDSYKFESEIPGGVAGADYSVDVRGWFDNIESLGATPIDTEHWLEGTNSTARVRSENSGNQGGLTLHGAYGADADQSFRPSGGWHGDDSTSKHVTSADATDTMRVTSDYGGNVYRFVADAHYLVTVKVGLRNFLSGLARGKPYGTRTRVIDAPRRLEFFLTDNDLHDHPEYLELVRKHAESRGEPSPVLPEEQEQKDGKWTPTERRLLPDAYAGKRTDDPTTAKGLLSFGAVTEVVFEDGRGALENAAVNLVEKVSPGATVVGSNNYHPGVATLINEHTTSFGVRNLANAGSEGNHTFHFVDRTGLFPRLVGVTFTTRPRPDADLPDGRTLATLEGKQVPRTAALDNVHRHIRPDGNALLEPDATSVVTSRSKGNQLSVTLGGQSDGHRPAGTLALERTGAHSDVQNSTRDISAWQRSSDAQYEFKVPTEYSVTVDWRPMTETLSAYLADKAGDMLIMSGLSMGVMHGLVPAELPPSGDSETSKVNATSHVRLLVSDTKPLPTAGVSAPEVPRTAPAIFGFDPSATELRPARIRDGAPEGEDVDLEAATHIEPADEVPADVRGLLAPDPWIPELPFDIREFDGSPQLAAALLAVDPSLHTNDGTRSAEATYNRLVTLVASGALTPMGPQSTAPLLNVEPSDTVPAPRRHAAEITVDGIRLKLSLYSPRPEDSTKSTAIDRFEFSNDSMSSSESKSTTVAPTFSYTGPLTDDGNHRAGVAGVPLAGHTETKGATGGIGSVRRNLWRTNAPTDGQRLRTVALVEVQGPKGTVWVTADMVLRTIETPPASATTPKPAAPPEDPTAKPAPEDQAGSDGKPKLDGKAEPEPGTEGDAKGEAKVEAKAGDTEVSADVKVDPEAEAKAEAAADGPTGTQARQRVRLWRRPKTGGAEAKTSGPKGGDRVPPPERPRGERSPIVDGVPAPAGFVWESMPLDGDCFFHAVERIVHAAPYRSEAELDQRITRLRGLTADELSGPRREAYFAQFLNLMLAERNRGRTLTDAERRAPVSQSDIARYNAAFDRQVAQIRGRGAWRMGAFDLVPGAAAAALTQQGTVLRLHDRRIRPGGWTFGEDTTAHPDGSVLIAHEHYYLAVPAVSAESAPKTTTPDGSRRSDEDPSTIDGDAKTDGTKTDGAEQGGAKTDGTKTDGAEQGGAKNDGAKKGGAKAGGAKERAADVVIDGSAKVDGESKVDEETKVLAYPKPIAGQIDRAISPLTARPRTARRQPTMVLDVSVDLGEKKADPRPGTSWLDLSDDESVSSADDLGTDLNAAPPRDPARQSDRDDDTAFQTFDSARPTRSVRFAVEGEEVRPTRLRMADIRAALASDDTESIESSDSGEPVAAEQAESTPDRPSFLTFTPRDSRPPRWPGRHDFTAAARATLSAREIARSIDPRLDPLTSSTESFAESFLLPAAFAELPHVPPAETATESTESAPVAQSLATPVSDETDPNAVTAHGSDTVTPPVVQGLATPVSEGIDPLPVTAQEVETVAAPIGQDRATPISAGIDPTVVTAQEVDTVAAPVVQGRPTPISDGTAPTAITTQRADTAMPGNAGTSPNRLRRLLSRFGPSRATGPRTARPAEAAPDRRHFRDMVRAPLHRLRHRNAETKRPARGDRATEHTATPVDSAEPRPLTSREDADCVVATLTAIRDSLRKSRIRIPERRSALAGRSRRELERAAGAELHGYPDDSAIVRNLMIHGPGAQALVVVEHAAPAANAVGAHAYRMVNEGGVVRVYDAADPTHTLPGQHRPAAVHAILFTPEGRSPRPVFARGAVVPAFPADVRIGAPENRSDRSGPGRAAQTSGAAVHRGGVSGIDGSTADSGSATGPARRLGSRRLGRLVSRLRDRVGSSGAASSSSTGQEDRARPGGTSLRGIRALVTRNFRPERPEISEIATDSSPPTWAPSPEDGNRVLTVLARAAGQSDLAAVRGTIARGMQADLAHYVESLASFTAEGRREWQVEALRRARGRIERSREEWRLIRQTVALRMSGQIGSDDDLPTTAAEALRIEQFDESVRQFDAAVEQRARERLRTLLAAVRDPNRPTDHLMSVDLLPIAARELGLNVVVLRPGRPRDVYRHGRPEAPFTLFYASAAHPDHLHVATTASGAPFHLLSGDLDEDFAYAPPPGHERGPSTPAGTDSVDIGRLDAHGVRVFDSDAAGSAYGEAVLDQWHRLTPRRQHAAWAYHAATLSNTLLREGSRAVVEALDRGRAAVEHISLLTELTGGRELSLDALAEHYDHPDPMHLYDVMSDPHRAGAVGRLLYALRSSDDPESLLAGTKFEARFYEQTLEPVFRRFYGTMPSLGGLERGIRTLDEAMGPLPNTEPVRVVRGLTGISFMRDNSGRPLQFLSSDPSQLVGTIQQEPGYLSTSVGRDLTTLPDAREFEYRLNLTVPPGTPGLWIGQHSGVPGSNELLLARDTRYRITGVTRDEANDLLIIEAEVLLPDTAEPEQDDRDSENTADETAPRRDAETSLDRGVSLESGESVWENRDAAESATRSPDAEQSRVPLADTGQQPPDVVTAGRELSAMLTGDGPIDFARVLAVVADRRAVPHLEQALLEAVGRPLPEVLDETVRQGRLSAAQEFRLARLLGLLPKLDLPAGVVSPVATTGSDVSTAWETRVTEYVEAMLGMRDIEHTLAFVEHLDRDPRALRAVQDAYRVRTDGRDLAVDLRAYLPEDGDYLDHVFAESADQRVTRGE
ncbi:ADP-ribosyltransferase [Nocardia takedensis]|uniref:ADP-ribosyltransferase n=1 Tax=Nocardia takedensis TaxID=259390 RepID=UPI003F76299C